MRPRGTIPLPVKLAYTGFMAVLAPVYLKSYGPTNFLYFCDVGLLLTLAGVWLESRLPLSMALVGILLPQAAWLADFGAGLLGRRLFGMAEYMFDGHKSLFLRGLSLFHGWLPLLLLWLVRRVGYDRRALRAWMWAAWGLMVVCYFWMPKPGSHPEDPNRPVNINYVFGLRDDEAQTWMDPRLYFVLMLVGMPALMWWPAHELLKRWARDSAAENRVARGYSPEARS